MPQPHLVGVQLPARQPINAPQSLCRSCPDLDEEQVQVGNTPPD